MKWVFFAVLVFLVGLGVLVAQESDDKGCEELSNTVIETLLAQCADLGAGEMCTLESTPQPLSNIVVGTALIHLPGTDEDQPLKAALLGDTSLTSVESDGPGLRLSARNKAGFNINLRGGPGTGFDQVGVFGYDRQTEADGRNEAGDWLRILTDNGAAWIATRFIAIEGDVNSLPVVEGNEPATGGTAYMLEPGACSESGLLLDYGGETSINLNLNGVGLKLSKSLLFIDPQADELQVTILAGDVEINAGDETIVAESGTIYTVALNEAFMGVAAAQSVGDYPFATVSQLPLQLIDFTRLVCIVGIDSGDEVAAYAEASTDSATAFILAKDSHYDVTEQQSVDDVNWWQISDGEQSGWVKQSAVEVLGDCENVSTTQMASTSADNNTTSEQVGNVSPAQDPASVMYAYLQARLRTEAGQMQILSCSAWDSQAVIQAQSFRSMQAELRDVACSTTAQDGATASVFCSGNIATFYNGEERLWPLGSYHMVMEGGQWRMCGEG